MQYMAGKGRIAKQIGAAILADTTRRDMYFEPFLGGGSSAEILCPAFNSAFLSDLSHDLIAMWREVLSGWVPPTTLTEDEYQKIRQQKDPSALRGFVGFGCSFGGKFFGGYARSRGDNMAARAARGLLRKAGSIRTCHRVKVDACDFRTIVPGHHSVVYCDPPYVGTQKFSGLPPFPADEFWDQARRWAESGAHVYVSEYQAPDGWREVWRQTVPAQLAGGSDGSRTERLFSYHV